MRIQIARRGGEKIAAGAATDFQHGTAGGRIEIGNQAIAAEQVTITSEVIDMALMAVDAIHQRCVRCMAGAAQCRSLKT